MALQTGRSLLVNQPLLALSLCCSCYALTLSRVRRPTCISPANCTAISIGFLGSMTSFSATTTAALLLAVEDINSEVGLLYPARLLTASYTPDRIHSCYADQELSDLRDLMAQGADFIVGPGCSTKDSIVNYLADHADLAMVSFRDNHQTGGEEHPTFGKLALSITSAAKPITDLVQHMGWKKVALVQDNRYSWYGCLWLMPAVKKALQTAGVEVAAHLNMDEARFTADNYTKYSDHSSRRKLKWDLVAKLIRPKARVVLYCGFPGFRPTSLMASREFMLGITKNGYLGDLNEYAFVLLHMERSHTFISGLPFAVNDGLDEKAKQAFKGALTLNTYLPPMNKEWRRRLDKHIRIAMNATNARYQWNGWETTAYDAARFLYTAAVKLLERGQSPTDGCTLVRLAMGETLREGASGQVWLDKEGRRVGLYMVWQVQNSSFVPVLNFTPFLDLSRSGPLLKLQKMRKLIWRNDLSKQPLSTPTCGFIGEHCLEASTLSTFDVIMVILSVLATVVPLFVVFVFFFWRHIPCIQHFIPVGKQLKTASWWLGDFPGAVIHLVDDHPPMGENNTANDSPTDDSLTSLASTTEDHTGKAPPTHASTTQSQNAEPLPTNEVPMDELPTLRMRRKVPSIHEGEISGQQSSRMRCIYKGRPVWIKKTNLYIPNLTPRDVKALHDMMSVAHENVVPFLGVAAPVQDELWFITDECERGTLKKVLENDKCMTPLMKVLAIMDVLQGMTYLYKIRMPHGHLKLKHCLVTYRWQVRVTGFGLHSRESFRVLKMAKGRKIEDVLDFKPDVYRTILKALKPNQLQQIEGDDLIAFWNILMVVLETMQIDLDVMEGREDEQPANEKDKELEKDISDCKRDINSVKYLCSIINKLPISFDKLRQIAREQFSHRVANLGERDALTERIIGYSSQLEERLKSKKANILKQREKSHSLLKAMLPEPVMKVLEAGQTYSPTLFDDVGVMFSHVIGMDRDYQTLTPVQLVRELDEICRNIDTIIERYSKSVYKVENISDCYMVVTGIPEGPSEHEQLSQLALSLLESTALNTERSREAERMKELHKEGFIYVEKRFRIGMHSGGKIHISDQFYKRLGDVAAQGFAVESRGMTYMKGKGHVVTHWLHRATNKHTTDDANVAASSSSEDQTSN